MSFQLYKYYTSKNIITLSKSVCIQFILLLTIGCNSEQNRTTMAMPPDEPESFPKLTERNRLLGDLLPERTCYDVKHYLINMDIDVDKKYIKGFVDISASAEENFTSLQFDLARKMKLNGVYYLDQTLKTTRKKDAVFVEFPNVNKGDNFTFRIDYEGRPLEAKRPPWDGGFVWEKDKKGRPYVSVACEGDGAGLWWPLKDHIADEPDDGATMTFTVPEELFCVSNGRLLDISSDIKNKKKSYTWSVNNPINNYNISVQLGHYVSVQDTINRNGVTDTLNHYVLDYHEEVARNHFKQAKTVIRFFEKYFGDYQWWDDGYKLVEVSYLGMEHQSAVTYGNYWDNWRGTRSWTSKYYGIVDGLLFHETAHEWWGNSVTAIDPAHMWIHEGMAVYSEAMFIEDQLGYNVMVDFLLDKRKGIKNKVPIVGPRNQNYWAFGDSYIKGAWIMHTLRHVIDNDETWFNILKSFAVDNAKGHVSTEDFLNYVIHNTGYNYQIIFYQYFYTHKPPTLEYYQAGTQFFYRWDAVSGFNMPIDINVNGIEGRIVPTKDVQEIAISEFSVIRIRDWELLMILKNNPDLIKKTVS
ncbi:MAG: M1 family metallopeptidase [Candidatus Neomarinimicrobiota bacterium]|nr:M1 family metallopeptidase [Candidatus Neomarinimicrobiota bacterium]